MARILTVDGVEPGTEEIALKESMELYKRNYKGVSRADFEGRYHTAFSKLSKKIIDLATIVINTKAFFMDMSFFNENQKNRIKDIYEKRIPGIQKAINRLDYEGLMKIFEEIRIEYIDVYLDIYYTEVYPLQKNA